MSHLRAHSAWRQVCCAGSTKFVDDIEGQYGRHPIPEAKQGQDWHRLVDDVLEGRAALDALDGQDGREHVARCLEFIAAHGYAGKSEIPFEVLEAGETVLRCRADYVEELEGAVMVVDWKFYHEPLEKEETEWQMKCTVCAAALDRGVNKGFAKLYLPILNLTYEYEVTDVLKTYQTEILPAWEILNNTDGLQAGPWCARCPVLGRCASAAGTMGELAVTTGLRGIWEAQQKKVPTVSVMQKAAYDALSSWSPARFRGVLDWLPVVDPFAKAVKQLLRDRLTEDPHAYDDWELKEKNLPATGDARVLEAATEDYLEEGEFERCKKLSVSQLRELLVKKLVESGQVDTKKAAGFAVEAIIGPHIERKTTTELRRKKL